MNAFFPQPIMHWFFQRATASFLLITLFLAPAWFLIFISCFLVFWHLYLGLEEILADYVHNDIIGNLTLTILKIFILLNIKYVFVFFII